MKVRFEKPSKTDAKTELITLMSTNPTKALIFSRVEKFNEVVAIVPTDKIEAVGQRWWVWLSGESGSYIADMGAVRSLEEVAKTLVGGGWEYQPSAAMVLEEQKK